jgi:hypothetical protein
MKVFMFVGRTTAVAELRFRDPKEGRSISYAKSRLIDDGYRDALSQSGAMR